MLKPCTWHQLSPLFSSDHPVFERTPKTTFLRLNAATHVWSLLECTAPDRSSQCGTRGFLGLTANPQHTFGPSWSVRHHGRPSSVGPAIFSGSPPTLNALGPSWSIRLHGRSSQCGTRGFSWAHPRQPTHSGSLLECTAPWPLLQCGTRGLLGLTANPHHLKRLEHQTSAVDVNLNQGFVPRPYPH